MEELFLKLLNKYEVAEETIINDRGTLDDYDLLEQEIKEFKDKLYRLLKNN